LLIFRIVYLKGNSTIIR